MHQCIPAFLGVFSIAIFHNSDFVAQKRAFGWQRAKHFNRMSSEIVHMHARTHARRHVSTHTRTHARTYAYAHARTHAHTCIHPHTYAHTQPGMRLDEAQYDNFIIMKRLLIGVLSLGLTKFENVLLKSPIGVLLSS